jgi:PAS domain S-box-containing protein
MKSPGTKSELLAEISMSKQKNNELENLEANYKQLADELQESENRYLAVFNNSIEAIFLTIPDGRILVANPEACRIFGRTEEEICQIGRAGLVDQTDPRLQPAMEERARTGRFRGELTFVRKNGTKFPGKISSSIFKDRDGNLMTSIIIRDITVSRQAEEAQRAMELKFHTLHQSMIDAFASVDMNGYIIDYNGYYLNMLGYSPEEIKMLTYKDVTPETWHQMEADTIAEQVLTRGYSDVYEKEYRKKDGSVFPVELRTTLLKDTKGVPISMWAIVRDITERKRFEEDRERLIYQLKEALSKVKKLSGLLPICASCKKIRDDKGYWNQIESYIGDHSEAEFSHGICPDCMKKLYPEYTKQTADKA